MKTGKILAGLVVAGATVVFAMGSQGCGDEKGACSSKMEKGKNKMMQKGCSMDKKEHQKHHGFIKHFMGNLDSLNLSSEQKTKLAKILDENKPKNSTIAEAFSKDSFDAQKFTQIMENKRTDMIKHQAEIISKLYEVLTSEQKAKLKEELKNNMNTGGGCDKGSSCRR